MPFPTRREVLAALAAAGAAPIWLEMAAGCGRGPVAPAPGPGAAAGRAVADLRQQLRQVVTDLERVFPVASALAEVGSLRRVRVDEAAKAVDQEQASRLVLAAGDRTSWFEQATFDLSPAGIADAAAALAARARGGRRAGGGARTTSTAPAGTMRLDPRRTELARWIERVSALHERTRGLGGSRIVYRAASLEVEDGDRLFVGEGRDEARRVVRSHARVLFLAWDGETLLSEEASRAGALGLEATDIPVGDLEDAVDGALSLLTGRAVPSGERDLVLDPTVAAMVVRHGIAGGLYADDWVGGAARAAPLAGKAVAPAGITLRDVPDAAGAFGARGFDDEGWPARPVALVERGELKGPLTCRATAAALGIARTGHARRAEGSGPAAPRPTHLELAVGSAGADQLLASVSDGFLVESGIGGRGDPTSWRFAVQARRAREIARGRLTGRSYGPVVVGGSVAALLGAARAVGDAPRVLAWRDPDPVSVSAPHLVTRAWLGRGS
jgi:predicted Zn-dependent protease